MLLFVTFFVGIILIVFGILFLVFPKALDEFSSWTSQVIINFEMQIPKARIPIGIFLFLLGVWVLWSTMNASNYVL